MPDSCKGSDWKLSDASLNFSTESPPDLIDGNIFEIDADVSVDAACDARFVTASFVP